MKAELEPIFQAILEGEEEQAAESVSLALSAGLAPGTILTDGMVAAMAEVGRLFEEGEYYVPEMLIAARAMQSGLAILKPYLQAAGVESAGKVVIGTVQGDLHDIGKNLVSMMLEGAGFEITDLGTDVSPAEFVAAVQAHQPDIVALSALLTTTMINMESTIQALSAAGLREQVRVIVGGAPLTADYARQIGADGYSPDASRAVSLVKQLTAGG
jgi:5-methyltetrahydrofolate--homocysteine methyltransferase